VIPKGEAFTDWIATNASRNPDRIALSYNDRHWTFAQLDGEVSRLARQLATYGVLAGDRVATLLHNGSTAAMMPHALLRLSATLVPLNTRLSEAEVAWQTGDARPRIVIAEKRTRHLSPDAVDLDDLIAQKERDVALESSHSAERTAAIIYTSGTTGKPKGAMLTVANFWWSAVGSALNLGVADHDRWIACLPLFHVGGLSIVFRSGIYGTCAVIHDGFDPSIVNADIDRGATLVSVVSVMLERILDERNDRPFPSTLRCALLGGGPASTSLLERCAKARVPVGQTYGLTETCSQVATLAPADAERKPGSAGKALHPNEIRIDADAAGEGEILARGPVVMAGYFDRPNATARALDGGWLHTGDIGRLDEDGYLYVLDRRDDLIISGGENVYPAEVESALLAHHAVAEVGVIGVDDHEWGRSVVAVVRLSDPADMNELEAHCRAQLAGYKVPREFRIVTDPLPRTASGKIRRAALRDLIRMR
jgi:O-succinylbenzoic acid--CoA ligase